MADITLRTGETGKGAPLTLEQVDQNFININAELGLKLDISAFTGSAVLTRILAVDSDLTGLNSTTLQSLLPSSGLPSEASKASVVTRNADGDFAANTVTADLVGNVTGNIVGDLTGNSAGAHLGNVTGNLTGNVAGNVTGNSSGTHTGPVIGNVDGNVTGNITGTLTGPSIGLHTGTVIGNVTGNLTGNASTVTNGLYSTGSYSNPSWLTALAGSKVTSIPNSSLQNSAISINGSSVSLGGSITVNPGFGGANYQWYDDKAGKAVNTNYTNTTGKTIFVSITIKPQNGFYNYYGWGGYIAGYVNGLEISRDRDNGWHWLSYGWTGTRYGGGEYLNLQLLVPPGNVYRVEYSNDNSHGHSVHGWAVYR